ncbi:MAG: 5-deoxy-glucuronate isomerase [Tepidanaerobacteraceae bacterium]|jgi:5-deoxy-glucuronate isomerase|nr:5-deoxy-glucuronate isomerase [Tepidanaerobacteraceae bacterium]
MEYFYPYKEQKGYRDIIKAKDMMKYVGAGLLTLDANESYSSKSGEMEIVLVILSGKVCVQVDDISFENLGERKDVFSGRATAVYIPKDSSYKVVEAQGSQVEIAVLSSTAERKFMPFVIKPDEVMVNHRGMPGYRREVHDIIVENGEGKVDKIIVGETFSYPGEWSSYPSHKHDKFEPSYETEMEEIYLFKVKPREGFGVQVMYNDDYSLRNAYIIKDNDAVAIPEGYHPVAAAPGFKLYYLWVMAGSSGRKLTPRDDSKLVSNMLL